MRPTLTPTRTPRRLPRAVALGAALPLVLLAGCSSSDDSADASTGSGSEPTETTTSAPAVEAAGLTPRLVVTYDGGIQVLDSTSLETIDDFELEGFNRINPAGDGRHVLVSTAGKFQVLDAGTWAEPHGDHAHYYTSAPALTDVSFAAEKPGHAVVHEGRTALFDDGTGAVTVFNSASVADEARELRERPDAGLGAIGHEAREHLRRDDVGGVVRDAQDRGGALQRGSGTVDVGTGGGRPVARGEVGVELAGGG